MSSVNFIKGSLQMDNFKYCFIVMLLSCICTILFMILFEVRKFRIERELQDYHCREINYTSKAVFSYLKDINDRSK